MIDHANELRRLAQAATPGPWLLRTTPTSAGLCHIISAADWRGAFIYGDGLRIGVDDSLPKAQELAANAHLIAAANPAAISELLDRLEAAETELAELRSSMKFRTSLIGRTEAERDALRAKITEMEQQEPVEWQCRSRPSWGGHQWSNWKSCSPGYAQDITKSPTLHDWQYEARTLYALPGAAAPEAKPCP